MKLLIGLGNPGSQYQSTRHNLGFMVVDQLATAHHATWRSETKFKAAITQLSLVDQDLILAKPQTYMNLSGEAVQKLMQYYKLPAQDVWVIFDDLDQPFGRLRIRAGGGAGGHNGIKSLIQHIGPDFLRLRIGIGQNDRAKEPSESYVLRPFPPHEQARLPKLLTHTIEIIEQQLGTPVPSDITVDLVKS